MTVLHYLAAQYCVGHDLRSNLGKLLLSKSEAI